MINTFVNAILAPTGMAVVLSLGILKLVDSEPHGFGAGLLGLVISLLVIAGLTVLYAKKPAAGWAVLIGYTVVLISSRVPTCLRLGCLVLPGHSPKLAA